jgi:DNA mismatch repair protein MSH4
LTSTLRASSQTVVAISEGRGCISEIGVATLDLLTSESVVMQYSDTANYPKTFYLLSLINPKIIIMPKTCVELPSKLFQSIGPYLDRNAEVVPTPRIYFNEQNGLEVLQKYAIKTPEHQAALISGVFKKFFASTAISALFHYIESAQKFTFTPGTVRFRTQSMDGTMMVDSASVKYLELVYNYQNQKSSTSLLGKIYKTSTAMGKRLLKATLLQPSIVIDEIQERLDAVQGTIIVNKKLLRNPKFCLPLNLAIPIANLELGHIFDLEQIISTLIQIPKSNVTKFSEQSINKMLMLRQVLCNADSVNRAMDVLNSALFKSVKLVLSSPDIPALQRKISDIIDDNVSCPKNQSALQKQRCYAVRSGYNDLLDVARKTYEEGNEDALELVHKYTEDLKLPFKLEFSTKTGYFLSLSSAQFGAANLPDEFINIKRGKSKVTFTSLKLVYLFDIDEPERAHT